MAKLSVVPGTPTIADEYAAELKMIGEERKEDRTLLWKTQEKFHAQVCEDAGDLLLIFKDGSAYHYGTREAYTAEEVKNVYPHLF
ncbi:MAG: hypothetical protein ABSC48_02910 [Terracidiphilus sp.]